MKKILTLSILSIISSPSFAEETKTLFGNQNLSPVFCQLNATAKTPSCVISIGAEAGTKLSSSIVIQKNYQIILMILLQIHLTLKPTIIIQLIL